MGGWKRSYHFHSNKTARLVNLPRSSFDKNSWSIIPGYIQYSQEFIKEKKRDMEIIIVFKKSWQILCSTWPFKTSPCRTSVGQSVNGPLGTTVPETPRWPPHCVGCDGHGVPLLSHAISRALKDIHSLPNLGVETDAEEFRNLPNVNTLLPTD